MWFLKFKMIEKTYNNADSFAMAFDEVWEKITRNR